VAEFGLFELGGSAKEAPALQNEWAQTAAKKESAASVASLFCIPFQIPFILLQFQFYYLFSDSARKI
jgi:hypothetical protein